MAGTTFYGSKFWKDLRARALDRDGHRCTVPGCAMTGSTSRLTVDHITTRPNVPYPTAHDILSNLRTLCATHDGQIKERASGQRRRGGQTFVRGCDASGNPLDPRHLWNRKVGP